MLLNKFNSFPRAMVLFVVFIIFLIGSSEGRFGKQGRMIPTDGPSPPGSEGEFLKPAWPQLPPPPPPDFRVEISVNKTLMKSCKEYNPCVYQYSNFEDTLELICTRRYYHGLIRWTDVYGFDSGPLDVLTFKLQITPDDQDTDFHVTCKTQINNHPKEIPVHLIIQDPKPIRSQIQRSIAKRHYLKIRENWTSNTQCYGIVYFPPEFIPNTNSTFIKVRENIYKWTIPANHQVITNFEGSQNGTEFYCIHYSRNNINSSSKGENTIGNVVRTKEKHVFYLTSYPSPTKSEINSENEGQITKKSKEIHIMSNNKYIISDAETRTEKTELKHGIGESTNDSQINVAAIVGGVLGTIIVILLGVLGAFWYKTWQRASVCDGDQVVYAEIEERRTAPDPPPRNFVPYSTVIGTLVPKPVTKS